jgi:hypothetical protein
VITALTSVFRRDTRKVRSSPAVNKHVCHRTNRKTQRGGTAILVRRGTDHYSVPVSGVQDLEVTAIHIVLVNRSVKLVAAYLLHARPLIE